MNVITAADAAGKEKHMSTFTIDADNSITAYASAEEANQGEAASLIHFDTPAALAKVSTDWPLSRFVEIWNGIPGQTPVKKFQDRKKAVARIWAGIQPLAGDGQAETAVGKPEARRKAQKSGKKAQGGKKPTRTKQAGGKAEGSNKKAEVIAMMTRSKGATLAEIMEATGWQKHTVRGFVSILGSKGGQRIESSKNAVGERTYKITK
jgi:Protein of unknown function (DUF3489)